MLKYKKVVHSASKLGFIKLQKIFQKNLNKYLTNKKQYDIIKTTKTRETVNAPYKQKKIVTCFYSRQT